MFSSVSHVVPSENKLSKEGSAINGDDETMHDGGSDEEEDSKAALNELALEREKLALLSLDGFLMVLSADGDITYVSENILEYLGISQVCYSLNIPHGMQLKLYLIRITDRYDGPTDLGLQPPVRSRRAAGGTERPPSQSLGVAEGSGQQ